MFQPFGHHPVLHIYFFNLSAHLPTSAYIYIWVHFVVSVVCMLVQHICTRLNKNVNTLKYQIFGHDISY
jgi:hypothetical protein